MRRDSRLDERPYGIWHARVYLYDSVCDVNVPQSPVFMIVEI